MEEPTSNPYTGKVTRKSNAFEGNARAGALSKAVLGKIPDSLLPRITSESWPPPAEALTKSKSGAKQSLVLLFTDRDAPSPLYKALAHAYRGRLAFGEVHEGDAALAEKYAVSKYPTLMVTMGGAAREDDDAGYVFKGDLKSWADLTAFLDQYALGDDESTAGVREAEGAKGRGAKGAAKTSRPGLVAPAGSVLLKDAAELSAQVPLSSPIPEL